MKYFQILDELFTSNSIIFLLIGLAVSIMIGVRMKNVKKILIALSVSFGVYAVCEAISNVHTSYFAEIILLIVGTASIGGMAGFLISLADAGRSKR